MKIVRHFNTQAEVMSKRAFAFFHSEADEGTYGSTAQRYVRIVTARLPRRSDFAPGTEGWVRYEHARFTVKQGRKVAGAGSVAGYARFLVRCYPGGGARDNRSDPLHTSVRILNSVPEPPRDLLQS